MFKKSQRTVFNFVLQTKSAQAIINQMQIFSGASSWVEPSTRWDKVHLTKFISISKVSIHPQNVSIYGTEKFQFQSRKRISPVCHEYKYEYLKWQPLHIDLKQESLVRYLKGNNLYTNKKLLAIVNLCRCRWVVCLWFDPRIFGVDVK